MKKGAPGILLGLPREDTRGRAVEAKRFCSLSFPYQATKVLDGGQDQSVLRAELSEFRHPVKKTRRQRENVAAMTRQQESNLNPNVRDKGKKNQTSNLHKREGQNSSALIERQHQKHKHQQREHRHTTAALEKPFSSQAKPRAACEATRKSERELWAAVDFFRNDNTATTPLHLQTQFDYRPERTSKSTAHKKNKKIKM